ncbi:hypothetical protein ACFLS8_02775 [Chloroflexota bacterium]
MLYKEIIDIIDKHLEVSQHLKEIIGTMTKDKGAALNEETINKARDLLVGRESLQAKERPILHSLFGFDD